MATLEIRLSKQTKLIPQESKLVHLLSESDNHSDVIGYFVHESKKCLIRTKRDMVLFLHSNYTVRSVTIDRVHNILRREGENVSGE